MLCVPQTSAHGRQLQTTVSNVAGLNAALANPSIGHIVLAAGTYPLTDQLSISRDLIVEAQPGTVVLDGQGSTRVLKISSGNVDLIGLAITGGYVSVKLTTPTPTQPKHPSGDMMLVPRCAQESSHDPETQGGGVLILEGAGVVTFTDCTIYENAAAVNVSLLLASRICPSHPWTNAADQLVLDCSE